MFGWEQLTQAQGESEAERPLRIWVDAIKEEDIEVENNVNTEHIGPFGIKNRQNG